MTTGSASGCGASAGAPRATRPSGSTWWQPTGMLGRCGGSGASSAVCVEADERGRGGGAAAGGGAATGGAATIGVRERERCVRCRLHGVPARATLARE